MSKRKAVSTHKHAQESLTSAQMRVKHTEMLNASFYRWIQDQHAQHRSELWRNGLEEYLQYGRTIQDRYPISLDSQHQDAANMADAAHQPKTKQHKPFQAEQSKFTQQTEAFAPAQTSFGATANNSTAAFDTNTAPAMFNFGGAALASSGTTAAQSDSKSPLALPPFLPVPNWGMATDNSPSIFSPEQPLPEPSSLALPSSVPFGSPSALPPLSTDGPIIDPTTTSLLPAHSAGPPADRLHAQPAASSASGFALSAGQPIFGSGQSQPVFGSGMLQASDILPKTDEQSKDASAAPQTSPLPFAAGSSQLPAFGSTQSASIPPFNFGGPQAAASTSSSMPTFAFGASQPATSTNASGTEAGFTPPFSLGAGSTLPAFSFGGGATPSAFGSGATPPTFGAGATPPAFGSGATAPFAFGASQPAASTGALSTGAGSPAPINWATPTSIFGSTTAALGDSAPSTSAPTTTAPFSFSWGAPVASQSTAAPASTFNGFSFGASGNTAFSGFGGQNGNAAATPSAQANGTQEEEDQPEPEAPTEYVKDEGILLSQEVTWRHQKPDKKWTKTAQGRVLARKSDKGNLYLQFVTSSGQVVSTANISGKLTLHTAAPTNVMGMLSVSVRQTSKGGDTVTLDPVTMMTMMTCKSKESAQGLLKSLNG